MSYPATGKSPMGSQILFGVQTMKKLFAPMVVLAALIAGCAEKETVPPPADEKAAPAEKAPAEGAPADDTATQNP